MKRHLVSVVMALTVIGASGQSINLRGTVKNQANYPAKGCVLTLVKAQVSDTTDSNGAFALVRASTAANQLQASAPVAFTGTQLSVTVSSPATPVSVDVFDMRGARLANLYRAVLPAGNHTVPLDAGFVSRFPQSILVMLVRAGSHTTRINLVRAGAAGRLPVFVAQSTTHDAGLGKGLAVDDKIEIRRRYGLDTTLTISSYEGNLSLALDLIPWEVLDIANAERNRYPDEVGKGLAFYPYDIARYLAKTGAGIHDYEAWCSEFTAWAYRAGGYPLTGGSQGGWMIRGSTGLRSWFQTNTEFVDRNSPKWNTFVPATGDYVRYDNSAGGHSGIVRYTSRDTLYTTEGNVSNTVRLRAIANWRNYGSGDTRIDGIGRRSGTRKVVL